MMPGDKRAENVKREYRPIHPNGGNDDYPTEEECRREQELDMRCPFGWYVRKDGKVICRRDDTGD